MSWEESSVGETGGIGISHRQYPVSKDQINRVPRNSKKDSRTSDWPPSDLPSESHRGLHCLQTRKLNFLVCSWHTRAYAIEHQLHNSVAVLSTGWGSMTIHPNTRRKARDQRSKMELPIYLANFPPAALSSCWCRSNPNNQCIDMYLSSWRSTVEGHTKEKVVDARLALPAWYTENYRTWEFGVP
jgi:hypothetical protein